jgi:hypothetical protein
MRATYQRGEGPFFFRTTGAADPLVPEDLVVLRRLDSGTALLGG